MPLGGVGHRAAGREPRGAADQGRGQPAASRQPRRDRRLRAGGDPRPLRSRPLADADEPRRDPPVVGVPRRRCARRSTAQQPLQRRRPAHPDRDGQLADAGRADPRPARALPVGAMAPVGAGQPRQRPRRRAARVRRVRRRAVPLRPGRRHPVARRRLPRPRPGRPALRARVRGAPAARRTPTA